MHRMIKVLSILSLVMLVCTLICGIWISGHPESDLGFHACLSGASVVLAIIVETINIKKCSVCKRHQ